MTFSLPSYVALLLQRTFSAVQGEDFTLSINGSLLAWNSAKGSKPDPLTITNGVLALVKQDLISVINNLAGEIRASYLSDGQYIVEEYRVAELDALAYKAAGYTGTVPQTLSDYATIIGAPANMVADSIIAAGQQMKTLLVTVRRLRLDYTHRIEQATTADEAQLIFDQAVAAINTLRKVKPI